YGVVAFAVAQQTRELGIRVALGAKPGEILALVLARGSRPIVAGLTVGLPLALAGAQVLAHAFRNEDFRVNPYDPISYAAVTLLLGAVAACAMLGPARRAAGADPVAALRQD